MYVHVLLLFRYDIHLKADKPSYETLIFPVALSFSYELRLHLST